MSRSLADRIAEMERNVLEARTLEASAMFHDRLDLLRLEAGDPVGRPARKEQAVRGRRGASRKRRSVTYEQGYQAGYHAGLRASDSPEKP